MICKFFDPNSQLDALALETLQINGIDSNDQEWIFGSIRIDKKIPYFRWGWGFGLSRTSSFRKERFRAQGADRIAAVFHQFDRSEYGKECQEYFAGWVPSEKETDLDGWIAFLNAEIEKRLREAELMLS